MMSRKYTVDRIDHFIDQYGSNIAKGIGNCEYSEDSSEDAIEIVERYNPKYAKWKQDVDDLKNRPMCEPMTFFGFYKKEIIKLLDKVWK
jgi:hypothetical protein